jgi:hypothetical protein
MAAESRATSSKCVGTGVIKPVMIGFLGLPALETQKSTKEL